MDITSVTTTPRRSRNRSAKPATAKPVRIKLKRSRTLVAADLEQPVIEAIRLEAVHDLNDMIATAAYYLAAARDFDPGHELDDWLEAERRIHARFG